MSKQVDLCLYRYENAIETYDTAKLCIENKKYKDAINRCYYAAFYAVKSVLALEGTDFKRHKDVMAYFNQHYVASEIISKDTGRKLGRLQKKREASDYDDFYLASSDEAIEQYHFAGDVIKEVRGVLSKTKELQERINEIDNGV